jgi:uncharacterized protein
MVGSEHSYAISRVQFDSRENVCAADLYQPVESGRERPCVVMAHGTAGTRDLGLRPYAEAFARAGLAVLLFDYRHFGESGGEPRQLIDIQQQLEDYRAALRFVRHRAGLDARRIALWGTSLSGGHVIEIAAEDPQIAAVVSQVPFTGVEFGRSSPRSTVATLKLVAAAIRDRLHGLFGLPPYLVQLVGPPGTVAAFNDADAVDVLRTLAADAPTWRNAFSARAILSLVAYRPGDAAPRITMPMLVCIADADTAGSVPWRCARPSEHQGQKCATTRSVISPSIRARCCSSSSPTRPRSSKRTCLPTTRLAPPEERRS